jgi:CDP-diacylglycerol--serine O-phosphatidyltransferase
MVSPRYFVPNGFTALSMVCGLLSVAASAEGNFELAAWAILWGVLLDKLDGTAARLLKATSGFGVQYDSFADFVVFGIAPAALVHFRMQSVPFWSGPDAQLPAVVASICCALFVVASSARLARFNITEMPMGDRYFYGIPTTVCGAFLASLFLTVERGSLPMSWMAAFPAVLIVAGVAMVSSVLLPKLKVRPWLALNIFQFANVAVAYVCAPLRILPEVLLGQALTYVVVGVGWCLVKPPKPDGETNL